MDRQHRARLEQSPKTSGELGGREPAPNRGQPGDAVQLQSSVGNRATARLLDSSPVVQRQLWQGFAVDGLEGAEWRPLSDEQEDRVDGPGMAPSVRARPAAIYDDERMRYYADVVEYRDAWQQRQDSYAHDGVVPLGDDEVTRLRTLPDQIARPHVAVVGAGPIGLLSAIEAKGAGAASVTIVEKRLEYSRGNVPILKEAGQNALRSAGVYDELFEAEGHRGKTNSDGAFIPLRNLEDALSTKAAADGARLVRGYTFESAREGAERADRRSEPVIVELVRNDAEFARHGIDASRAPRSIRLISDLIVVASGGAAHIDERMKATRDEGGLGLEYTELLARDVGAYGLYESPPGSSVNDQPVAFKQLLNKVARGGTQFAFKTEEHNYILYFFSGLSEADLRWLRAHPDMLRDILRLAGQASGPGFEDLKQGPKSAALFDVTLGRVDSPISPFYPAVVIGDAAVSPHPQTGSGINAGVGSLPALNKVVKALRPKSSDKFPGGAGRAAGRREAALAEYGHTVGGFTKEKIVGGMFQMAAAIRFAVKKLTDEQRGDWHAAWNVALADVLRSAEAAVVAHDDVAFDAATAEFDWLYADARQHTDPVNNLASVYLDMLGVEQDRLAALAQRERLALLGSVDDSADSESGEIVLTV